MYKLDVTSHINANHNRNMIKAAYTVAREMGVSNERHIQHMDYVKKMIREQDAQPAAWSFGPTRFDWLRGRIARGEQMTAYERGCVLEGVDPRDDEAGARKMEAMEDADPSITPMLVHVASEFMRSRAIMRKKVLTQ